MRLDHLLNISPHHYEGDDPEFPRNSSMGAGKASYGAKGNIWGKMHDYKGLNGKFEVLGQNIRARDIK